MKNKHVAGVFIIVLLLALISLLWSEKVFSSTYSGLAERGITGTGAS